jgi:hypothetical protein
LKALKGKGKMMAWTSVIIPIEVFEGLSPWGWWIIGAIFIAVLVVVVVMIGHLARRARIEVISIQTDAIPTTENSLPAIQDTLQILSVRWRYLPNSFLQWVATCLTDADRVQKFIELSEEYRLHTEFFPGIVKGNPRLFNERVAAVLSDTANHDLSASMNPKDFVQSIIKASDLFSLALAFQPKNPTIMLGLGATLYMRRNFARALELFNEGLPLLKEEVTTYSKFAVWFSRQPSIESEQLASINEMITPEAIKEYERMRDECLMHCETALLHKY